ncbi:MAG: N-acetylmuramoyl-L-alanine amidase [Spirochaetaceae bacterium]|jgi:N-acetylmuramoyl-L-alanine amidase|nr:N-acetylmuramoyl-L-alanine amidase [Spirochaetaceae bacterium]
MTYRRILPVFHTALALFLLVFSGAILSAQEALSEVTIQEAASRLGAALYWDPLAGAGILVRDGHQMSFRAGQDMALLDYKDVIRIQSPVAKNGAVYAGSEFLRQAEEFFLSRTPPMLYRVGAILIDPGHGGRDSGAVGSHIINGKAINVVEKDIALKISLDLESRLKSIYPDKQIILTRRGDTYPTLEERVEMANSVSLKEHEAIIYISMHANAAFDKEASGFEVWYLTQNYRRTIISEGEDEDILPILNSMMEEEFTTESVLIAKFIMDELQTQIGDKTVNRGIKEEEWFVVRNANMPSVLIEVGFVSNPAESLLLTDENYLRKITTGVYNGLVSFITHFERSRGFTNGE